jgi:hypothetical protein
MGSKVSTRYVIPKTPLDWDVEKKIVQLQVKQSLAKLQQDIGETAEGTPLAFSDFTISEFQNLNDLFTKQLQEQQNKRSKLEADASNALRSIEFISGEVSGLGLIDIMVIYMALWSLDVDVLLNLIDDTAAERLSKINELSTAGTTSRASQPGNALDAYAKLADRIQTILSYGDMLYKREHGATDLQEGGDIPRDNLTRLPAAQLAAQSFA